VTRDARDDATGAGEWTLATLRAHLLVLLEERDRRYERRFTDLETALRAALTAAERAVGKAETATERRFEGVNEFRQTLSDQAATFVTRAESAASLDRVTERITELADRVNRTEGRSGGVSASVALVITLVGVLLAVATVVLLAT
jgi:biopolymer transport protein ExbB/TolQ